MNLLKSIILLGTILSSFQLRESVKLGSHQLAECVFTAGHGQASSLPESAPAQTAPTGQGGDGHGCILSSPAVYFEGCKKRKLLHFDMRPFQASKKDMEQLRLDMAAF